MAITFSGFNAPYSSSTNFSLTDAIPDEVQSRILQCLINQSHSHRFIPFLFLTCRKWYCVLNTHPCISFAKVLFNIHDKEDAQLSEIPEDAPKSFVEEEFSPQEFILLDRMHTLYPKSFTILLNYSSKLFGKNSLYLSLLHRYPWKIEEVEKSQNANIQSIAHQQLAISLCFIRIGQLATLKPQRSSELEKWSMDWEEDLNILQKSVNTLYQASHCGLITLYFNNYFNPQRSKVDFAFKEQKNKQFFLNFFKYSQISLQEIIRLFPGDREIVLAAVNQDGGALCYADASLKSDREIVLAAVNQDGLALEYADASLKSDRKIILAAVNQDGGALCYADASLKSDREIVLAAVNQDGGALCYADASLKSDREIVLAAVKQNGFALQYAEASLKSDREIVLAAVKQNGLAFRYADASLQSDREIVLAAVNQDGGALCYVDASFKSDREIVLAAVKQNGNALGSADRTLQNEVFILEGIQELFFNLENGGQSSSSRKRESLAANSDNQSEEMMDTTDNSPQNENQKEVFQVAKKRK